MEKSACIGFQAAGIPSGIKKGGKKDLGLIFSTVPASVAGVFTRNKIKAAPVLLDMARIASGTCQAVIANSGNANCFTGGRGMDDARAMAAYAASGLGISEERVLVASTGVIGEPFPIDKIKNAAPALVSALSDRGMADFAEAIMTTDTVPKMVTREGVLDGKSFHITGVAKGAGMIHPDMATLLCFVCTDAGASPDLLLELLRSGIDRTFNRITVDGDTSTNDTVLLLANGLSGVVVQDEAQRISFQKVLEDVLICLAKQLVKDGEGATKLVEVMVRGALSDEEAYGAANTVAQSSLVKTAFFGEDANWGRILAAIGRSGVAVKPDTIDIYFDDIQMVGNGMGCGKEIEKAVTAVLKQPEFTLTIDLNIGNGCARVFTCDLSVDYVKINADYRS